MNKDIESLLNEFKAIRKGLDELEAMQLDTHISLYIQAQIGQDKQKFQYYWDIYRITKK